MILFGGLCHIEASSSWIKSSHDWLLCGLFKLTDCQFLVPKAEREIVRWHDPPSQTVQAGSWWDPLQLKGAVPSAGKHLPWMWRGEGARRGEARVLISLQTCASCENVQKNTSQTCFNPRHEPLCCWWGGLGAFASSPDTHWVQQSSMPRYRQGVRFNALDCQLSDKWGKADTIKGRVAQCTQRWQEPKIEN